MALSHAQQITQLYIGYFHRAPDPEGLNYWIGRLTDAVDPFTIEQIAQSFSEQPEALDTYAFLRAPEVGSADGFIAQIYQNLFNRAPDAAGAAYWKGQLESGAVSIGDFIASVIGGATNSAAGQDVTTLANKVEVGLYYAEQVLEASVEWTLESARSAIDGVTSLDATVVAAKLAVDQFIADANADVFQLTVDTDVATANVFDAGLAYTPGGNDRVNTLQDEDVLTGRGDNPTLNATLGNANDNGDVIITPTLNGIETVNVRFTGSGASAVHTLDLQDATGVDAVNITGITDPNNWVSITNLTAVPSELSLANTQSPAGQVDFTFTRSAVVGTEDETTLTLSNVNLHQLVVQQVAPTPIDALEGIETINLVSTGEQNHVGRIWAEDLQTLNVSGDENLALGEERAVRDFTVNARIEATRYEAALANVAGSLETINASGLEGDFQIALGDEVNAIKDGTSGVPVEFRYTGAQGNDTVILTTAIGPDADAKFDGGAGENKIVVTDSVAAGSYANFQTLDVRSQTVGGQNITVNTALLTELEAVSIRNEGQDNLVSANNALVTTLNNVNADVAQNISVLHGTSSNNGLADNRINVNTVAGATTVGLAIEEGVNVDPRFNVQLNTSNNVNSVSLHDNDSESNTVQLINVASLTNTVTVTNGREGRFLNLDASANVAGEAFGIETNGANGNATSALAARDASFASVYANTVYAGAETGVGYVYNPTVPAAAERVIAQNIEASEFKGDLIVRVGGNDQTIRTGTGDDTVIFDRAADLRAGLTISDKVALGEGFDTIIIGGNVAAGQVVSLGASEWTNLSGVDAIRLGNNNGNGYNLTITDQFVGQTDNGSRLVIINNDGDLTVASQQHAVVDLTSLTGNSGVDFYGENGTAAAPAVAGNRLILSDASANGNQKLDGGDREVDVNSGNDNVYEVRNSAVVTEGDLANVKNFQTIEFTNSLAIVQDLVLQLTNTVVDALVDAGHMASAGEKETLRVQANDNALVTGAFAQLTIEADSLANAFNVQVRASRGDNDVSTGAGDDVVVLLGNYNSGVYGADAVTGFDIDGVATNVGGALVAQGEYDLGAGANQIRSYGAINLAAVTFTPPPAGSTLNFVFFSQVTLTDAQVAQIIGWGGTITFAGSENHTLVITHDPAFVGSVDLSGIVLEGTGNLNVAPGAGVEYTGQPQNNGDGEVVIDGEVAPVTVAEFLAAVAAGEAGTFNIVDSGDIVVTNLPTLLANEAEINTLKLNATPTNPLNNGQFAQFAQLVSDVGAANVTADPVAVNAAGADAAQVTRIFNNLDLIKEGGLDNLALTPAQLTEIAAIVDGVADLGAILKDDGGLSLNPAVEAIVTPAQFATLVALRANLDQDPATFPEVQLDATGATSAQVAAIVENLDLIDANSLTDLTLTVEQFNGLDQFQLLGLAQKLGAQELTVEGNADANTIDLSFLDGTGKGAVVEGKGGADTLIANTDGDDVFIQGRTDSLSVTARDVGVGGLFGNDNFTVGNTLTFGNGLDIITDFQAGVGGDVLDLVAGTAANSALGRNAFNGLSNNQNWFLSGNIDDDGVFQIVGNGAVGSSTLILQGYSGLGTSIDTNGSALLLVGVESNELVAANFI